MTISDMIKHVGDEHVEIQSIHQNLDSAKISGKNGKITLLVEPSKVADLFLEEESSWVGILVWLPRSKIPTTHLNEQH